jgi:hypothetical protein
LAFFWVDCIGLESGPDSGGRGRKRAGSRVEIDFSGRETGKTGLDNRKPGQGDENFAEKSARLAGIAGFLVKVRRDLAKSSENPVNSPAT